MFELLIDGFLIILELFQDWSWRRFLLLLGGMATIVGVLLLVTG